MEKAPTTITSTTTATLIAVTTIENCDDNLVPSASRVATSPTITSAPQSSVSGPTLTVPLANPSPVCRYLAQPLATTAPPIANSRTRFQPMVQATNSPKVA